MKHKSSWVAAAAALFASVAPGQGSCPQTKAVTVPRAIQFHGAVKCGSVRLNIGGTTFSSPGQGCPLLALLVPEHEVEAAQTNGQQTQAEVYAQVSTQIFHYECRREWLLFIPWGSSCRLKAARVGGVLPRMNTSPCSPERPRLLAP